MASARVVKSTSVGLGILLLGTGLSVAGGIAPAAMAASCVAPAGATTNYVDNQTATYTAAPGTTFVKVTADGGSGSSESNDLARGGAGAEVISMIAVPASGTIAVSTGMNANGAAGAQAGGTKNGGNGDTYTDGTTTWYSGGGGSATVLSDGATVLLAAGGGGGAGYGNTGGAAATSDLVSKAAGAVTDGGDGTDAADPGVSGHGGTGGSTTPGTGGEVTPGYGAGSGSDGVGRAGGDAFVETGANGNVGAGGGGGGYQGGGGGGGGGFGGSGGAGSSYSVSAYSVQAHGSAEPSASIEAISKPAFQSDATASFTQQKNGSFTICAPSIDTPTITEAGALPDGVTFVDNGDGTATLKGTPTGGTGTFPLTLTSTGVAGATTQAFTLTVDPATSLAVTGTDGAPAGLLAIVLLLGGAILIGVRRLAIRVPASAR